MSVCIETMYDILSLIESADTSDTTFDDCVCWDFYTDEDEPIDVCMAEVQKHIDLCDMFRCSYGFNLVADITKFVKEHIEPVFFISQFHREKMTSMNPEDMDSLYAGVRLINAMQAGYASDDEYLYLLKYINPDLYWKWMQNEKYGYNCYSDNEQYLDVMIQEIVNDMKDTWGPLEKA